MTYRRLSALLLALLLAVAACSTPESPSTTDAAPTDGATDAEKDDKAGGKSDEKKGSGGKKESPGSDGKGGDDTEADGSEGDEGSDGLTEGSNEDDNSSAAYPAAGSYTFSQRGYEEFCQGTNCERQQLPPRQPVSISTEQESSDGAIVVTEIRAGNRTLRTTTRFTPEHALITKVYVRFAYSAFTFEENYSPEPPVDSLRFPITAGESWKGTWKDSTSGDYEIEVFEKETVSVGGRSVQAFRVQTFTNFRGQFNGRSKVETWIDPATKAIVKTRGVLNVTSAFGRYSTSFATQLQSGPGY